MCWRDSAKASRRGRTTGENPDPVLTANHRADELHDIVSTGQRVLGLTSLRRANTKFDADPQTDTTP